MVIGPPPADAEARELQQPAQRGPKQKAISCRFRKTFRATITAAPAPTTLVLDDGARVVLRSVLAPREADLPGADGPLVLERKVLERVRSAVINRNVEVATLGRPDRYGRRAAHIWLLPEKANGTPQWLQDMLLRQGLVRFAPDRERAQCATLMLRAERAARAAGRGLWQMAAYRVRQAARSDQLWPLRYTFQIVKGRVVNASQTRSGTIYLNFGSNWRRDFTARVRRTQQKYYEKRGVDLLEFKGRTITVRGWLDLRGGPLIDIHHTHQIWPFLLRP